MLFGADWGFANDPTALVRSWMHDERLFIDFEAFGYKTEIDETPALFDRVPGARIWPIKGDPARPETISYMRRQGFNITGAEKWEGCVEDGITHLKGFRQIVIHERCKHMQDERRLYRYKVDPKTQEVLPLIVDKHNHGWDSVRYSLDGYIQRRGVNSVWARLAG
jgi:phage terminase large subunit